jgi:hypothetical protein
VRLERVKSYFHCDDKQAKQIINRSDRDRIGFHSSLFDTDWRSPANYHLALNTGYLSPAYCAEIVKTLLTKTITPDVEARHAKQLKALILGHNITHHILYEKGVSIHFLETRVLDDKVELLGVANSKALVEAAVLAAQEAAGSLPVKPEIQVVQEYNVGN